MLSYVEPDLLVGVLYCMRCWQIFSATQLITGYNTQDATITSLLTTFDWYIVPVANPDGYEYSHTTGVGSSDCVTSALMVIFGDEVQTSTCMDFSFLIQLLSCANVLFYDSEENCYVFQKNMIISKCSERLDSRTILPSCALTWRDKIWPSFTSTLLYLIHRILFHDPQDICSLLTLEQIMEEDQNTTSVWGDRCWS